MWCTQVADYLPQSLTGAVGLYVPGGTAVLPSTALMLAVPAGIAGCKYVFGQHFGG